MTQSEKKILLIAPSFFGYAKEIRISLEKRGYQVWQYEDRPFSDNLSKAILRLAPWLLKKRADAYFTKIASDLSSQNISQVLVIKGEALSITAIRLMRQTFKEASFTLYFWDSYRNMPHNSTAKVTEFDKAFTFDQEDANSDPRLAYRPLFYLNEYLTLPDVVTDIDLLFVGTAHTDRYAVTKRLSKIIPVQFSFKKLLYLPSIWIFRFRRVASPSFWQSQSSEFVYKPLSKTTMLDLIARARIIIDIERSVQTGLTMRSIEMLGAGKKMITTNPSIASCDFYSPSNIAIIDRNTPVISEEFLSTPYTPPSSSIIEKYSIDSWVNEVLFGTHA
jgi:hypothetical protein